MVASLKKAGYSACAMTTTLTVEKRAETGSTKMAGLREKGLVPGIVYGPKEEPIQIAVSRIQFEKAWAAAGESTVITLSGLGEEKEVLIHDVDYDHVRSMPLHVDFYAIEKGKKVTVNVPLSFVGVSPAEKELGGSVVKVLHEIEIEAMPKDLPHEIEVDIVMLKNFESAIHVKDLKAPAGVTILTEGDEVVAVAEAAHELVEEEAPVAVDMSSIEVAERGKKEEEGEEAAS